MLPSLLIAASLLGLHPQADGILRDQCDVVELNRCYNEAGVHQYDQVIFWTWYPEQSTCHVLDWRLLKQQTNLAPVATSTGWQFAWHDRHGFRIVRAHFLARTWTTFDPEAVDRAVLPELKRVWLSYHRRLPRLAPEPSPPAELGP